MNETDLPAYQARLEALGVQIRPSRSSVDGEGLFLYFSEFDNHLFELHTGTLEQRFARYQAGRQQVAQAARPLHIKSTLDVMGNIMGRREKSQTARRVFSGILAAAGILSVALLAINGQYYDWPQAISGLLGVGGCYLFGYFALRGHLPG